MVSQHWSRDMYTLWWRDEGSSRMRVSFAPDKETLLKRAARCATDGSEIALYDPNGERIPIPGHVKAEVPGQMPKKKRKKKARAPETPALAA